MAELQSLVSELLESLTDAAVDATPRVALALLFLIGAGIAVRLIVGRLRRRLHLVAGSPAQERTLEFLLRVVLWFGIGLVALALLGFEQLATALGTASGFFALAVAFGLREALGELVAGLYLIKDDRFVQGARISADGETGVVEHIGIRRTTFRSDETGDLTVVANNRIEPKWTLHGDGSESDDPS